MLAHQAEDDKNISKSFFCPFLPAFSFSSVHFTAAENSKTFRLLYLNHQHWREVTREHLSRQSCCSRLPNRKTPQRASSQ